MHQRKVQLREIRTSLDWCDVCTLELKRPEIPSYVHIARVDKTRTSFLYPSDSRVEAYALWRRTALNIKFQAFKNTRGS